MAALTITQIIEAVSEYTVSTDITANRLSVFQQLVAGDLSRLNPGFLGDDLTELEAYLVLDRFENRTPENNIESEKIKDHSWKFKTSSSSSAWMDKALLKIASYNQNYLNFEIVERSDSRIKSLASDLIRPEEFGTVDTTNIDNEWEQDY